MTEIAEFLAAGRKALLAIGKKREIQAGVESLTRAAEQGDADAMMILSSLYYEGDLVAQDRELSVELLEKAAAMDHLEALLDLAKLKMYGKSYELGPPCVRQNLDGARFLFERAEELGSRRAMVALANFYANGIGDTDRDDTRVLDLLTKAANRENQEAQI